jgi:BirA family biotin operon repressor/biotin-[acetyl-CoA-carboxylase] ligase
MDHWPFVRELRVFDELESTSDLARSMIQEGSPPLPMAVRALRQTVGRGQRDSRWWSDEGSLTFTLVIDPSAHGLRLEHHPRLSLMTAVAVIEAIAALGLSAPGIGIRWPNDVEAGGKKLGGILPERVETDGGHRLLIGIGLNVLTRLELAPPAVRPMAASLAAMQPESPDPELLPRTLAEILSRFERKLSRLAADDPDLARQWDSLNLLRGQAVRVALGPRILEGKVRAIDAEGALCVDDGLEVHRLFGGQVLRVPLPGEARGA